MSALSVPPEPVAQAGPPVIVRRKAFVRRVPPKAKLGAAILTVFILVAIVGPSVAPYDPSATIPGQALPHPPTAGHLLGTTSTGQDVLSQLLVGAARRLCSGLRPV